MINFGATSRKQKNLEEKMLKLGIKESDFLEKFIRSKGPGGQNTNKVSTCVYIKHIPTGIETKCSRERMQSLNRFFARRIIVDKIEQKELGEKSALNKKQEKIRRQKKKRSKRAKEKILKNKKIQSEKKILRKKVESNEE